MRRWILWWGLGALTTLALMLVLLTPSLDTLERSGGWVMLAVLLGVGVAAQLPVLTVEVSRAGSSHTVSLIEAAAVATFLLVGASWGFVATVSAVAVAQGVQNLTWPKRVFNLSMMTVAAAGAAVIYEVMGTSTTAIEWPDVAAVTVAMLVFGMVNWSAVMGVVARLEGRSVWSRSPQSRQLSGFSTLGNIAIGVMSAVLWRARPDMAVLAAVPLVSIYLAYKGIADARASLTRERTQAEKLGRVLDAATEGVVLLDSSGGIELWSPAIVTLTGIQPDVALGSRVEELLTPEGPGSEPVKLVLPSEDAEYASVVEWRIRDVDGAPRDVSVSVAPLLNEGELVGTVLLVRDVTRQREVERLKDDFLMRVSHELRTPLTPIRGFAESLRTHRDRLTPEMYDIATATIIDRSDHLLQLVDNLLLVATSAQDVSSTGLAPVRADELITQIVERVLVNHPDRSVDIDLAGPVGDDGDEPVKAVLVDGARLSQIAEVLVDNALRYSGDGARIEVQLRTTDHYLDLTVTDTGRGIPKDQLDRIFDRFHRVEDPMTMTTGGLGVGLFIARRLARLLGGDLSVVSQLGTGSTFSLHVPIGADAPAALRQRH